MKNLKLTNKEIALLYSLIIEKIDHINIKKNESVGYIENLQDIELKIRTKL